MGLFGRSRTTVGLDIGSGLIKVAVVDHGKKQPELVKVAVTPLLADAIVEGEVMDPGIVSDAVRGALSAAGVKGSAVVTAVGGRDVIIKKIQIERVKEQQARELMRWEAEQHVPFDMESVELDFQILDPDGGGDEMQVLLVAAKRELIENKLRILTDAGLKPSLVDVDAFALHNAFEVNHPDAMSGIVGLVNIGHEVTNINILDEGVPILTRDLTVGTRRFREDLQRERGLSADEADQLLQGYDRSSHLDSVIESRGEEIAVGVERAAAFLASSARTGGQLSSVYTCGGGSRIPGLTEALANRLRIRVDQANPLANLKVRDGAFGSLVTDEIAPLMMLPIGLALRSAA
ncbi:MAG: type IV pilus assembly protein PilM [Gemmatimonadaceae bacterium]|nr:type IV pilus assembly protein PilM [Gemmatimonadaceae bacterium]NUQ93967.1 type IV pilus assembly protein PilM [Gemmatimonadaceae bacterium]NUR32819.1 type IV pilus assembly protein PilM [Gemmatimonadaceae bacterium]NUS97113.1 type IV pilus assembly protein PilM [Gemmatimonadaceae bacterium]